MTALPTTRQTLLGKARWFASQELYNPSDHGLSLPVKVKLPAHRIAKIRGDLRTGLEYFCCKSVSLACKSLIAGATLPDVTGIPVSG
jgi:hypothetical protein